MRLERALRPVLAAAAIFCATSAGATTWDWSYVNSEYVAFASGTFTTTDTADAAGWYGITGVTGEWNGSAIVSLAPSGSTIPFNDYPVDNLLRVDGAQLTIDGVGFYTADGHASNAFYADWEGDYREFSSATDGTTVDQPITFMASMAAVPEPSAPTLLSAGLLMLLAVGRRATGPRAAAAA